MHRLLKKKAFETITLYHMTSSQLLPKIVQDGYLMPDNMINQQTLPKTNYTALVLADGNTKGQPREMPIFEIIKNKRHYQISQNLQDKIAEFKRQVEQSLMNKGQLNKKNVNKQLKRITIPVIESQAGSSGAGIYLLDEEHNESYINKNSAVMIDPTLPVIPVELKVKVATDALGPDSQEVFHNDEEPTDKSDVPQWKQSLETNHGCIYQGPIPTTDIEEIYFHVDFLRDHHTFGGKTMENFEKIYNDFDGILDQYLHGDKWIPFNEGLNDLSALYELLKTSNTTGIAPDQHQPDEAKITRHVDESHGNYFGGDVIYKDLTQEEINYLNTANGENQLNLIMFSDEDIYYGYGADSTPTSIITHYNPDMVVVLGADTKVFTVDLQEILNFQDVFSEFAHGSITYYFDPHDDWVTTLEPSRFTQFNTLEEIQNHINGKKQQRTVAYFGVKKRLVKQN